MSEQEFFEEELRNAEFNVKWYSEQLEKARMKLKLVKEAMK